jgi:hypothetical protein
MPVEKPLKSKPKKKPVAPVAAPEKGAPAKGAAGKGAPAKAVKLWLRSGDEPRKERRFEPKASGMAVVTTIAMSIGAVIVGAGTYGEWFRKADLGPHPASPYLLGGGALVLIAVALFGQRLAKPARVGDAGIALEKEPGEIDRIEWRDVGKVYLDGGALTVTGPGTSITLSLAVHRAAAAQFFAEATRRLPARVEEIDGSALGAPIDGEGEVILLEAPQVAGQHCKASDKLIAFEKDARFCGRCGEVYHKESVPPRCETCEARLKA